MDLTTDSVQKKQKICEEFKDGNPPFAFVWSGRGRSGCCCFSRLHYETGVYGCEPLYGDYTGVWTAIILRLTEKEEWREVRGEGLGRSDRQPVWIAAGMNGFERDSSQMFKRRTIRQDQIKLRINHFKQTDPASIFVALHVVHTLLLLLWLFPTKANFEYRTRFGSDTRHHVILPLPQFLFFFIRLLFTTALITARATAWATARATARATAQATAQATVWATCFEQMSLSQYVPFRSVNQNQNQTSQIKTSLFC